jgi:glycosyltransferase involved in cell wall biosynthesis
LIKKLVVIPSDPIAEYEKQGLYFLKEYYNPGGFFDEVYALSPYEKEDRFAYGMHIMHVEPRHFSTQVRKIKPDVVRAYGGYWACDLACKNKIPRIPVIVSVHDTNPDLLYPSVKKADLVICMAQVVADLVATRGVSKEKIRILPNRIDLNVFLPLENPDYTPIQKFSLPEGKHILCIGRQTEQKNIDTLVRAMAYLPNEYALIFIGGGDSGPYENLAKELNVSSRCFWLRFVPNAELPLWHSWADCFCLPSRWEGFGFVFIEAAACGNPVITSNIAPMNEYLTHDVSACLVDDYENPSAIAATIRKVCENEAYQIRIANGGIVVAKRFARDIVDKQEMSYYSEVLDFFKKPDCQKFSSGVMALLHRLLGN